MQTQERILNTLHGILEDVWECQYQNFPLDTDNAKDRSQASESDRAALHAHVNSLLLSTLAGQKSLWWTAEHTDVNDSQSGDYALDRDYIVHFVAERAISEILDVIRLIQQGLVYDAMNRAF